ncbi:DUF3786 domain-containing protein [Chloroflexota bacterium]
MEDRRVSLPKQQNYEKAYRLSYELAQEKVAGIEDIDQQCRNSGTEYLKTNSSQSVIIKYLGLPYEISFPNADVTQVGSDTDVPIREQLLILHYFVSADGTPLSNKPVTFQELPEGVVYSITFAQRTITPLTRFFGQDPGKLLQIIDCVGGYKADFGDVAATINAFPYVPITIVFWQGDDELAPQGNILFDSTIINYVPTEDITVLCETITWKLIRQLKESF